MPELVFDGVDYVADSNRVLGPVDLRLECSGITAVLGANGAGKSLFLGLAQGMLIPSTGSVTWDGQNAHATRNNRSIVFQSPTVLRRSVFDNVAFALNATGRSQDADSRVEHWLERVELADRIKTPAAALSGGEGQRMALARALVTNPQVVLMDEPSSNLDPKSTAQLERIAVDIAASGVPILIATHDIAQAKRLAQTVVFFDQGQITEITPAAEFFAAPRSGGANRYLEGLL